MSLWIECIDVCSSLLVNSDMCWCSPQKLRWELLLYLTSRSLLLSKNRKAKYKKGKAGNSEKAENKGSIRDNTNTVTCGDGEAKPITEGNCEGHDGVWSDINTTFNGGKFLATGSWDGHWTACDFKINSVDLISSASDIRIWYPFSMAEA